MLDAGMRQVADEIMTQITQQVEAWADQAVQTTDLRGTQALEQRVHEEGRQLLSSAFEQLLQAAVDRQSEAGRTCPHCGGRRRHKGRQRRGLVSRVGAIQLSGVYWRCSSCGQGGQSLDQFTAGRVSGLMTELWTYLGTACGSFAKAAEASQRLLGIKVATTTIHSICLREGRRVMQQRPQPAKVQPGQNVTGSCDGLKIHTREQGWKETRAFRYDYGQHTHGGAALCSAEVFAPKLRQAAIDIGAGEAENLFFPADTASWIDRWVPVVLPDAIRIIDIWHAWQHIHEAARVIWGEGNPRGQAWAQQRCEELKLDGGRKLWDRLRRARFKDSKQQQGLDALLGYLERHAHHMDYPKYTQRGWPISSGPMESFCKQLARRLKGPGMRWCYDNVDPIATLTSLYCCDQWDQAFPKAA